MEFWGIGAGGFGSPGVVRRCPRDYLKVRCGCCRAKCVVGRDGMRGERGRVKVLCVPVRVRKRDDR